jgi:hypothetical protein
MRKSGCAVLVAALLVLVPGGPVGAQTVVPANPGDFIVDLAPVSPPTGDGGLPTCDPSIESIAERFLSGQTSVTANCTYSSVASQQRQTGTVSNPTLAGTTGDAGFNRGTVEAVCDVNLTSTMSMSIGLQGLNPSMNMTNFSGQVLQACAFNLAFTDAARSTVTGTIEANARLGRGTGSAAGDTISIDIAAKVYVTGGTGAFAGQTGTGTFNQTEEIEVPLSPGGSTVTTGPPTTTAPDLTGVCTYMPGISDCSVTGIRAWCAANSSTPQGQQVCAGLAGMLGKAASGAMLSRVSLMSGGDVMKLRLSRKAGSARILSPAPAAGTPTAAATVTSKSKVRVAATAGAVCTVTTNRGVVVGSATARGKQAVATITPKANAYRGAASLVASCTSKGQKFNSNRVKIKL